MGMIDFAPQFRPTVGYDQLLDRSVAANDVASPFSMSEGHLGKAERHVDFRCPDERAGLWTQWMQECLETFEAGTLGPERKIRRAGPRRGVGGGGHAASSSGERERLPGFRLPVFR